MEVRWAMSDSEPTEELISQQWCWHRHQAGRNQQWQIISQWRKLPYLSFSSRLQWCVCDTVPGPVLPLLLGSGGHPPRIEPREPCTNALALSLLYHGFAPVQYLWTLLSVYTLPCDVILYQGWAIILAPNHSLGDFLALVLGMYRPCLPILWPGPALCWPPSQDVRNMTHLSRSQQMNLYLMSLQLFISHFLWLFLQLF